MLNNLVKYIWIIFLPLTGMNLYDGWEAYREEHENLKNEIPLLEEKIKKQIARKNKILKYLKDVQEAKGQVQLVFEEVKKISQQLPSGAKTLENLQLMRTLSNEVKLNDITFKPLNEEIKDFYAIQKYKLSGTGTFLQFLTLMEKIGATDRLFNIRRVHLTRSKRRQRGQFQSIEASIILESYRHNSSYESDEEIDKFEKVLNLNKKEEKI